MFNKLFSESEASFIFNSSFTINLYSVVKTEATYGIEKQNKQFI